MRRRAGTRASCFNLHGATALLITSLAIYTLYTIRLRYLPPPIAHNAGRSGEEQIRIGDDDEKNVDIDGDGIPDWCYHDEAGISHCLLSDGTWVTNPSDGSVASPIPPVDENEWPTSSEASFPTSTVEILLPSEELPAPTILPTTVVNSYTEAVSSELSLSPTTYSSAVPTAHLPSAAEFKSDNGTKWKIEYVGDIQFTDQLADKNLVGDKCRSSALGNKVIWNCGDMWCDFDYTICGFAMGPAMYGTDDVMTINTTGIEHIYNWDFLRPHESDPTPEYPYKFWGMDTSNVAAINDTHGVAYGYEIWRGTPDGSDNRRGNAVASITLGDDRPLATRLGPLLTGPDEIEMGMLAILRDGDYIYIYSEGGPSRLMVTRVPATDDVFDVYNYESLEFGTETWTADIPIANNSVYGMTTTNWDQQFGCSVYGSVFYSNYFSKYIIICNIDMTWTNMYASDTPWGPWSEEYGLLHGWTGYGSMAHPEFSPGGSHKEVYFSQGPNDRFNMFKITFNYEEGGNGLDSEFGI